MEYLRSLLVIGVDSVEEFIIKFGLLFVLSTIILWIVYLLLVKITRRFSKFHKDIFLRLQFMWALLAVLILFNVYWFVFIKSNGLDQFKWDSPVFYLDISPQILAYGLRIGLFVIVYRKYSRFLKD